MPNWWVSRLFDVEDATGIICGAAEQIDAAAAYLHCMLDRRAYRPRLKVTKRSLHGGAG
jgi:hypothetical protein